MALTKVTGHVVKPDTNIQFHNTKSTGIVTFAHTDNATSSTTGALQVTGGVGIVKDLHVGGNITIGGTLTYDDVTNIDSLGIITARGGIHVGPVNAGVATVYTNGNASFTGIVTATSFVGPLTGNVTGTASGNPTLTSGADNRVITATGANALTGESKLTFDASTTQLKITRDDDSNSGLYVFHNDGNECARLVQKGTGHEGALVLKDGGTATVLLDGETGSNSYINSGNVGIGSAIPTDKLDVQTGASDEVTKFKVKTSGQLELTRNHASAPFIKTFMSSGNPTITLGDSGGTKTVINGDGVSYFNAGNVGIGSDNPESNLTILKNSSSDGPVIRLRNPNGGDGTYIGRIQCADASNAFYAGINFFKHDTNDGEIRFRTKLDGTNTDIVTIVDGALGIGNLQTAQSTSTTHTSKTKFYIDSTKFTKVARLAAGNITSAGWFTVAKIASSNGNYFKCYASIGGDFTQDMCIMELTGAFSASGALSNAYAEPVFKAHRVGAHSTDRITRARFVKDSSNVTYLQIYIASGHSSYWGKSVLEYTMGTYAQNIADSGSAAMFEAQASGLTGIRTLEVDDNAICVNAGSHKFYSGGNATERLTIDSDGRMLLGTTTPGNSTADDLTIATSSNTGITIRSGTNGEGNIFFGDATSGADQYRGMVRYYHNGDALAFHAAGSERLRISNAGTASFKGGGASFQQIETNPYNSSYSVNDGKIAIKGDLSGGNYFGWRQKGVASGSVSQANAEKLLPTINDFTYPNTSNGLLIASTSKIGFSASAESPQYASGVTMLFDSTGLAISSGNAFDCSDAVNTVAANVKLRGSGKIELNQPAEQSGRLTIKGTNSNGSTCYAVTSSGKAGQGIDITCTTVGDGNYGGAISFGCGGNGRSAIAAVQNGSDDDVNGLAFFTHSSNNGSDNTGESLRIASDGAVGINQTNPNKAKLHVVGGTANPTIVAKFKGSSGADARTKIGLSAAYSDTANDTEGQAYVGALRNGSGNSSTLFFEISQGNSLKETFRVIGGGCQVGGAYRFANNARTDAVMPNTHNIGDVSSNSISYYHNAGIYYVYLTCPTDGNWYTMFTSFNDSASNFRGICGDASSKNSFYWYFNPTSPSYGVNPYGEKWHHGAWNTGSVTFRLNGTHPNWDLQIKCTSYYSTSRTAQLRAVLEVYY